MLDGKDVRKTEMVHGTSFGQTYASRIHTLTKGGGKEPQRTKRRCRGGKRDDDNCLVHASLPSLSSSNYDIKFTRGQKSFSLLQYKQDSVKRNFCSGFGPGSQTSLSTPLEEGGI
jgi:hypothetical protein